MIRPLLPANVSLEDSDGTVAIPGIGDRTYPIQGLMEPVAVVAAAERFRGSDSRWLVIPGSAGQPRDGNPAEADAGVTVVGGSLEGSNVNTVEAMVNMITLARQFDTQMKLLQSADENARRASSVLNINS